MRRRLSAAILPGVALRCLIVDDDSGFLEAARDLLECDGIAVVGVASTIAEALRLSALLRPEVTLVDIELGEENGIELARTLGDAPGGAASSVILLSAYAEQEIADLLEANPALAFLSKRELSGDAVRRKLADYRASR
jgi:DNA-binding NarL/FixJ family response regulator